MLRRRLLGPVLAACLAGLAVCTAAPATTGPGYLLQPPKHLVPLKVAKRYVGYYQATRIGSGSRLTSSAMFAEFGERRPKFLIGGVQFYGHDASGQETSWVATLFQFRLLHGRMHIAMVGPGGLPVLGHLVLRRNAGGSLAGTLRLHGSSYPIAFRKRGGHAPPTLANGEPSAPASPEGSAGWGAATASPGHYDLAASTGTLPATASEGTGVLSSIVQLAQSAGAASGDSGGLTVITRPGAQGQPPSPGGILAMRRAGQPVVLYLTELRHTGGQRTANVHSGSFGGPVVGSFSGVSPTGAHLVGTLTLHGATVSLDLERSGHGA